MLASWHHRCVVVVEKSLDIAAVHRHSRICGEQVGERRDGDGPTGCDDDHLDCKNTQHEFYKYT